MSFFTNFYRFPVTSSISLCCVLMFLVTSFFGEAIMMSGHTAFNPEYPFRLGAVLRVFVHGSCIHIVVNLAIFVLLGSSIEKEIPRKHLLLLFSFTLLMTDITSWLLYWYTDFSVLRMGLSGLASVYVGYVAVGFIQDGYQEDGIKSAVIFVLILAYLFGKELWGFYQQLWPDQYDIVIGHDSHLVGMLVGVGYYIWNALWSVSDQKKGLVFASHFFVGSKIIREIGITQKDSHIDHILVFPSRLLE